MEKENVGVHASSSISGVEATRKSLSALTAEHVILQEQLDVLAEERDAAAALEQRKKMGLAERLRLAVAAAPPQQNPDVAQQSTKRRHGSRHRARQAR
mgnify:CR=1 FL=1